MKTIKFRPLRIDRKTGKVIVASYMQWRKVKTADYNEFNLIVDAEYKNMDGNFPVHDHRLNQLFFHDIKGGNVPVYFSGSIEDSHEIYKISGPKTIVHAATQYSGSWTSHLGGAYFDCDGIPVFSHYTADYMGKFISVETIKAFVPLTVEMVVSWVGWMLYQLENSRLEIIDPK